MAQRQKTAVRKEMVGDESMTLSALETYFNKDDLNKT